jgi:hypothetical protein
MRSTRFTCGNCGKTVSKNATCCPHCGARLANIKCQNCGYIGTKLDFRNNTCPKCHSRVGKKKFCPECQSLWDNAFCEKCGKTNWGTFLKNIVTFLFSTPSAILLAILLIEGEIGVGGLLGFLFFGTLGVYRLISAVITLIRRHQWRNENLKV